MATEPMSQSTGRSNTLSGGETLLDSTGRAVSASYGQAEAAVDQLATFVRGQPIAAALIALGLGYVLGRLRI